MEQKTYIGKLYTAATLLHIKRATCQNRDNLEQLGTQGQEAPTFLFIQTPQIIIMIPLTCRSQKDPTDDEETEDAKYEMVPCGDAFLKVSTSSVVGIGGENTGLGLFTLKAIPRNTFVCAYAPTAIMKVTPQTGDYVIDIPFGEHVVSLDGNQNTYEIGLGKYCNDGSFPYILAPSRFSKFVAQRVNCEFAKRDNEIWIKTKREISPMEELFVRYSHDGSYWKAVFTADQLSQIKEALLHCGNTRKDVDDCIRELEI